MVGWPVVVRPISVSGGWRGDGAGLGSSVGKKVRTDAATGLRVADIVFS
jgi:hypothetical protein